MFPMKKPSLFCVIYEPGKAANIETIGVKILNGYLGPTLSLDSHDVRTQNPYKLNFIDNLCRCNITYK